jgi:hypothetical protein
MEEKMFYGHNFLVTQQLTKTTLGLLNFDQIVGGTKIQAPIQMLLYTFEYFGWANK